MSIEERVVHLETRAAYQDKLIEDLDEVLREFTARLEALETHVKDLERTIHAPRIGPPDEPPPHY